ncbi:rhomboid family intramembrane serine protease [Cerasicoccus frondis]|uniref:rhomboid family intramembrane serine protease n=1 Tax=Cerasicoccus frondis TaxID=490090 RepID=UPI0028526A5F|nr:rhomboid family intramembrane serine protease [Cerasicoccus frondis]
MADAQNSSDEPQPAPPSGVFAIGPYASAKRAREHGLVILAMRLTYELVPGEDGGCYLWVDEADKEAIYEQLAKYQRENKNWPPRPLTALPSDKPASPLSLVGYGLVIIAMFIAQSQWPRFTELGVSVNTRIFGDGQWQLPMTALTLHGGIDHLIANLVSGVCFGFLINRIFGAGLGWTFFVLSGYIGNLLNAWFYWPEYHGSLGASTAIFGALGMLVGHALAGRFSPAERASLKHRAIPLGAGVVILLLTGFSGGNTDVLAHVWGFVAGVPLGAAGYALQRRWPAMIKSKLLLALPLALIATAWGVTVAVNG